jgi:hypothetical protein
MDKSDLNSEQETWSRGDLVPDDDGKIRYTKK